MKTSFRPQLSTKELMKNLLVICVLLLATASLAQGQKRAFTDEDPTVTADGKAGRVQGLVQAMGWRRFDTPYGISFTLPGPANYEPTVEAASPNPLNHYSYGFFSTDYSLSVEAYDGFDGKARKDPAALSSAADAAFAILKQNLKNGFSFGEVSATSLNGATGRQSTVTNTGNGQTGRAQVFVTPTRMFVILGLYKGNERFRYRLDRFFESIKIQAD